MRKLLRPTWIINKRFSRPTWFIDKRFSRPTWFIDKRFSRPVWFITALIVALSVSFVVKFVGLAPQIAL